MDFDGVHTNNRALLLQNGEEAVEISRADGMGIRRVKALGIETLILSMESNPIVETRARKLDVECLSEVHNKLPTLINWLESKNLEISQVAYVGNDINDTAVLRACGLGVVVGDAHPSAVRDAQLWLRSRGGAGAIRELTDLIELARGSGSVAQMSLAFSVLVRLNWRRARFA